MSNDTEIKMKITADTAVAGKSLNELNTAIKESRKALNEVVICFQFKFYRSLITT